MWIYTYIRGRYCGRCLQIVFHQCFCSSPSCRVLCDMLCALPAGCLSVLSCYSRGMLPSQWGS